MEEQATEMSTITEEIHDFEQEISAWVKGKLHASQYLTKEYQPLASQPAAAPCNETTSSSYKVSQNDHTIGTDI